MNIRDAHYNAAADSLRALLSEHGRNLYTQRPEYLKELLRQRCPLMTETETPTDPVFALMAVLQRLESSGQLANVGHVPWQELAERHLLPMAAVGVLPESVCEWACASWGIAVSELTTAALERVLSDAGRFEEPATAAVSAPALQAAWQGPVVEAPAVETSVLPALHEPHQRVRWRTLLDAATVDLYRVNAFRVAQLPVTATSREINRQVERMKMREKLGTAVAEPTWTLGLQPAPGLEDVRHAMDRLADPERRLIDEFFWFWPADFEQSAQDRALAALVQRDADTARRMWVEQERGDEPAAVAARHNSAVLAHLEILDREHTQRQVESADEAAPDDRAERWPEVLARWHAVLEDEGTWTLVRARVRQIDEPQLTDDTVEQLRSTLPEALLAINASIAARAAEAGRTRQTTEQVELLQNSGLPVETIEFALRRAVQPLRERLKLVCETAEAEAEADHAHADEAAIRMLRQTEPLLNILDSLLPADHPGREAAHDEVALRVHSCLAAYANETQEWQNTLVLLKKAMAIAVSQSAQDKLQAASATVEGNFLNSACWFCRTQNGAIQAKIAVSMFGDVQRTAVHGGTRVNWRYLTVDVPRCEHCRAYHKRREWRVLRWGLMGGLLGFGGCSGVTLLSDYWFAGLLFISAGLVLGGLVARYTGRKPEEPRQDWDYAGYEPIAELLRRGWTYGSRPAQ